jgi:hypothetical protein
MKILPMPSTQQMMLWMSGIFKNNNDNANQRHKCLGLDLFATCQSSFISGATRKN